MIHPIPLDQLHRAVRAELCPRCPRRKPADRCQAHCKLLAALPGIMRTIQLRDPMLQGCDQIVAGAIDQHLQHIGRPTRQQLARILCRFVPRA
jgi:hypothetical protein